MWAFHAINLSRLAKTKDSLDLRNTGDLVDKDIWVDIENHEKKGSPLHTLLVGHVLVGGNKYLKASCLGLG